MFGTCIVERDEAEDVPSFRARAREAALSVGAATLIFDLLEMRWVDDLPAIDDDISLTQKEI